jgi:two-component system, cell cycle sensor histidine kinase and response regulator CckA
MSNEPDHPAPGRDQVARAVADAVERAVAEQYASYREIVEHTQDVVAIVSPDTTIHYVNPSSQHVLGYAPEELMGKQAYALLHPDDRERVVCALVQAKPGQVAREEYRFLHKDGAWRTLEGVGRFCESGPPDRVVITSRDISVRLRAEAERAALQAQLHHAQKLETVGTLAGGMAHDFSNILTSLFGFASLVYEALPPNSPLSNDMLQVLRSAERARNLVQRLLTFSRHVEPERRPLDLGDLLDEALLLARASLPASVHLEAELERDCGAVLGDPSQLHQVVLNLCTNAAHAMREGGGVLRVALRRVELDEWATARHPGLVPGPYARIDVSDSGHGMSPETLARAFEPFFTTKAKGEGTGLGLAVVQGMVAAHAGAVEVTSGLGVGSCFSVLLPLAVSAAVGAAPATVVRRGDEHILLVDDEPDVIAPVERLLAAAGYHVRVASSADEALAMVRAGPTAFDLVVTDRTMPGRGGPELAEALHALRPDLKVVLISGYGAVVDDVRPGLIQGSLAKPFTFQELSGTIRRVLDG